MSTQTFKIIINFYIEYLNKCHRNSFYDVLLKPRTYFRMRYTNNKNMVNGHSNFISISWKFLYMHEVFFNVSLLSPYHIQTVKNLNFDQNFLVANRLYFYKKIDPIWSLSEIRNFLLKDCIAVVRTKFWDFSGM